MPLSSVYELARKNKIPGAKKIGKHWRFLKPTVHLWVTQPLGATDVLHKGDGNSKPALTQNKGSKILLIEDDPSVLRTIQSLLTRHGYEVVACKDGVEGFECFKSNSGWGLIVSDIRMAHQDGIETVERIRELEKETRQAVTPIILMTAYAESDYPVRAIKLGVRDYFLKPFDTKNFLTSVQNTLCSRN